MKKILLTFGLLFLTLPAFAQQVIQVSTAIDISFGPFVSPTDGVTLQTGLVSAIDHATTGIKLSKNGGALTIREQAVTASTYDGYGNYIVHLSAVDTGTIGRLRVQFAAAASCLPVWKDFQVVGAAAYDRNVTGNVASVQDVWEYATRTVSAATNITSSGNAVVVGADDQVLLSATAHTGATIPSLETLIGTPVVDVITDLGTHDAAIKALLPAALVGGKIDAHVNDIAANAITATSIATDAITADKIAADSIGASEIAANAIGASEIATDAIGSAELAASAILKMGIVTGTAQSGGNSSITLAAGDAGTAASYTYGIITITGGTGQGQQAIITAYDSGTKVATIFCQATASGVWTTNPDLTSVYSIIPGRR